jgi:hypothetical protein
VMIETLRDPWLQQVNVHRRFSASLYPDASNFAYPAARFPAIHPPQPPLL